MLRSRLPTDLIHTLTRLPGPGHFLLVLVFLCSIVRSGGQSMADYSFAAVSGSFTPLSGATTLTISGGNTDDGDYENIPIGFEFWYVGQRYANLTASTNGYIVLGTHINQIARINNILNGGIRPVIAPFWDNLNMRNGSFSYLTSGVAGSRVFTAQWLNICWDNGTATPSLSFQVKFYEGSGIVEFIYRRESGSPSNGSTGASIGIASHSMPFQPDYLSLSSATTSPAILSTSEEKRISTRPQTGQIYRFTPPQIPPAAPSNLSVTAITQTGLALNWQDNSNNELGFAIYNSTDGVNFNYFGRTNANSTAFNARNLPSGTSYTWRVVALGHGMTSSAVSRIGATTAGNFSGTKTIGPGGDYASITAAITAVSNTVTGGLNGSLVLELNASYTSASETFPITIPAIPGARPDRTLTIRPAAGVSNLTITSGNTAASFLFNGMQYVIIDGRPGGVGTTKALTLENTSGTAVTLNFVNDASNNTIQWCTIRGANGDTRSGIIYFGSGITTGNDNNTIRNNDIREASSGPAVLNGFYSEGSTTTAVSFNSENIISNNNIFNFLLSGVVLSLDGNLNWTISGNSFYWTSSFQPSQSFTPLPINIGGGGTVVTGNFIGGTAPNAGGSAWTLSGRSFRGIGAYALFSPATIISDNIITNINVTSSLDPVFVGISIDAGSATVTGNTIGSGSGTAAIRTTSSSASPAAATTGINVSPIYPGSVTVSNNTIGSITANGSSLSGTPVGAKFTGIIAAGSGGPHTISGNLVGSTGTAKSIHTPYSVNNTQYITGILASSNLSTYPQQVLNNTIANLCNEGGNDTIQHVIGIGGNEGINIITGNTIRNLSINTRYSTGPSLVGITLGSTATPGIEGLGQVIAQNTVHSLSQLNTAAPNTQTIGIYAASSTTPSLSQANLLTRNFVHSFSSASATGISVFWGIYMGQGVYTLANNMVRLGIDAGGNSVTSPVQICGIYKNANNLTSPLKIWHNSVYIGGTGATGGSSMCLWRISTLALGIDDIRNNIFVDNRSNAASATGTHIPLVLQDTVNMKLDNNIYYSTGTGSHVVAVNNPNARFAGMRAWRTFATGFDHSSAFGNPNFVNATGPASAVDLHLTGTTPAEGQGAPIAAVTEDFDGQARSNLTPVDIGADAGNFAVQDITAPAISHYLLSNTSSLANRSLTVRITDASGVNNSAGASPRLYYKKLGDNNVFAGNSSSDNGWKWVEAGSVSGSSYNFTFNYSKLRSAVALGDVIQYFVVAQDLAATPNVAAAVGIFTGEPAGVALTSANFPILPYVNQNTGNEIGPLPKFTIAASILSTISVGTGQTYTSLTNSGGLFEAINGGTLSGNITVNITSDLTETGQVPLYPFAEDGAGNYRITITTNSATGKTLSGTPAGNALIRIFGADRVSFDGSLNASGSGKYLTFRNNASSASAVFWIGSLGSGRGAEHVALRNLIIRGSSSTADNYYGIYAAGQSFASPLATLAMGADNHNLTIANNDISNVSIGIYFGGGLSYPTASPEGAGNNLLVSENRIGAAAAASSIGFSAIVIANANNATISRDTVLNVFNNRTVHSDAIYLAGGVTNSIVTSNVIRNIVHPDQRACGILVNTGVNAGLTLVNNMIDSVQSGASGNSGSFRGPYGIAIITGTDIRIYYNSIYMRGATSNTSSAAVFVAPVNINTVTPNLMASNIDMRNNIFVNMITTAGNATKTCAIFSSAGAAAFSTINYNDYVLPATNSALASNFFSNLTTMAELRAGFGGDQNSVMVMPSFNTLVAGDLHLASANSALHAAAITSSDLDNDNESRTLFYMGADEIRAIISDQISPASPVGCIGSSLTLSTLAGYADGYTRAVMPGYQWYKNGVLIPGATLPTLSFSPVQPSDTGRYHAVINFSLTNPSTITTRQVTVRAEQPVTVASPLPKELKICPGTPNPLTVTINGAFEAGSHQWQRFRDSSASWENVVGASSATLNLNPDVYTAGGFYRLTVRGTGSVCSPALFATDSVKVSFAVPEITVQPAAQTVCRGATVSLSTEDNGNVIRYQWQKDGQNIDTTANKSAATGVLVLVNVNPGTTARYRLLAFGCGASAVTDTSEAALLTVAAPAKITKVSQNVTTSIGGSAKLSVETESTDSTTAYRWYKGSAALEDNTRITGTRSATLNISNVVQSDLGNDYKIVVTGLCGSDSASNIALLKASIVIDTNPQGVVVCEGNNASFTVKASTSTPGGVLSYRWMKDTVLLTDGTKYKGTNTATFTIQNAGKADTGRFAVLITVQPGAQQVRSSPVALAVNPLPVIVNELQNVSICEDETLTLSIGQVGDVSYKWMKDGEQIIAAGGSYSTTAAAVHSGDYMVIISNTCGSDTSRARVTVMQYPIITVQPQNDTIRSAGGTVFVSVVANLAQTYQWYRDGVEIAGATQNRYEASQAGEYKVRISNSCGSRESSVAKVEVLVGVEDEALLAGYALNGAMPNPATEESVISFSVGRAGNVRIVLRDELGREVRVISEGYRERGNHEVVLRVGSGVSSGVYYYSLVSGGYTITRPIVIMK